MVPLQWDNVQSGARWLIKATSSGRIYMGIVNVWARPRMKWSPLLWDRWSALVFAAPTKWTALIWQSCRAWRNAKQRSMRLACMSCSCRKLTCDTTAVLSQWKRMRCLHLRTPVRAYLWSLSPQLGPSPWPVAGPTCLPAYPLEQVVFWVYRDYSVDLLLIVQLG